MLVRKSNANFTKNWNSGTFWELAVEKDCGVSTDIQLSLSDFIATAILKANMVLGMIHHCFLH